MARHLEVVILGDSASVEKAFAKAAAAAQTFAGKLDAVGARTAAIGKTLTTHLTLPIIAVGGVATKTAIDFQNAMELLHTQAGLPQKAIEGLSKSVLALAGPTATAPETLSAGLYHLTSQGLRGRDSLEALRVAAEGAKMGQADLESVTNALGAVIASKIGGVHSYEQAMGELNATVGAGDMRMQDLADAMGTGLAAKAAVAHVSLTDVNAALATFGDNNIRGAEAGTLLASTLRVMEGPSGRAASAMKKMGIDANKLGSIMSGPGGLVAAIGYLQDKLSGLSHAEKYRALTQMFGSKQAGGVLILIDQLQRLKTKEEEVTKGGKSFADNWAEYTKTTAYHLASMGAAMQAAGVSIGTILLPVVSQVANAIAGLLQKFQALPGSVQKAILVFAGIAAAIGPVVSIIGKLTIALTFLADNPIVLAIAAVAALTAVLVAAVVWPDKLKAALEKFGVSAQAAGAIVTALGNVVRPVWDIFKGFYDFLTGQTPLVSADMHHHMDGVSSDFVRVRSTIADLKTAWNDISSVISRVSRAIMGVVRDNWGSITAIVKGAIDIITTSIRDFVMIAKALWREFGSYIVTYLRNEWELVKATVKNALTVIRGIIDVIGGLLHGDWGRVWQGIKEIAGGIMSEVAALVENFANNAANEMAAFLKVLGQLGGKIKDAFADAGNWLLGAGKAIVQGLIDGMESMLGALEQKAKDIAGAAKHYLTHPWEIGSPSKVTTRLGEQIMQGFAVGFTSGSVGAEAALTRVVGEMKVKMNQAGAEVARMTAQQTAEQNREQDAQNQAALKAAKNATDRAAALQTIRDTAAQRELTKAQAHYQALQTAFDAAQQKMQAAQQKAQQKLQAFQQKAGTAFDRLANKIQTAFQAGADAYVSPAQQQINALMAPFDQQDLQNAITDAKNAATDAQAQLDAMLADTSGNTTAQQITEQRQSLLEAQQSYQRALVNLQVNGPGGLAAQAAQQDQAHQQEVAAQQDKLNTMLDNLRNHLTTAGDTWNKGLPAILKIIGSYDGSFSDIGSLLGNSFSKSLMDAVNAAVNAARAVASANGANVPTVGAASPLSRAHGAQLQTSNYNLNIAKMTATNADEIPRMFKQMEALAA